jgi:hypothetical protein
MMGDEINVGPENELSLIVMGMRVVPVAKMAAWRLDKTDPSR